MSPQISCAKVAILTPAFSVTVVSIIRLNWMVQFASTQNVTWDYTAIGYWSSLEVHVGVIVACLPALRALQHRLFPNSKTATSYYNDRYAQYGYGTGPASPFPSAARNLRDKPAKHFATASQASIMRPGAEKEFIPLDDYDSRHERDAEAGDVGRGVNNTHVECASVRTGDSTYLDTTSARGGRVVARPQDAITVKKEYNVTVEYVPHPDGSYKL